MVFHIWVMFSNNREYSAMGGSEGAREQGKERMRGGERDTR